MKQKNIKEAYPTRQDQKASKWPKYKWTEENSPWGKETNA